MELQLGISKIKKYAVSESGDTLEFIERPGGGISIVLVDGQRSGKSAKRISNKVAGKVVSLLTEGVRDGAAARAASDFLYHERRGKVMATLTILSVDLVSRSIVVSRNSAAPVYICIGGEIRALDAPSESIGVKRSTRPVIDEFPMQTGFTALAFTDGITNAGYRQGKSLDIAAAFTACLEKDMTAQEMSDALLDDAMRLDQGRPVDDISVFALQIRPHQGSEVRRMSVTLPLGPN